MSAWIMERMGAYGEGAAPCTGRGVGHVCDVWAVCARCAAAARERHGTGRPRRVKYCLLYCPWRERYWILYYTDTSIDTSIVLFQVW